MGKRRECPQCRFDVGPDDSACPFCDTVLEPSPPPLATPKGKAQRSGLLACPDCGATVSARAVSCPGCGCPVQAGRRQSRPNVPTLVSTAIVGLAVFVLFNMLTSTLRFANAPPNPPRLAPGDRAVVASKGDGAFVAFGAEAWRRMLQAQARRDNKEMHQLEGTGQIAHIINGTTVQVIGSGTMMLQLRMLAGPHEGREAW